MQDHHPDRAGRGAEATRAAIRRLAPVAWRAEPPSAKRAGRRRVVVSVLFAGVLVAIPFWGLPLRQRIRGEGVTVTYYRGIDFRREVCTRHGTQLLADYDGRRPAFRVPAEGFSARWESGLVAASAGEYRFETRAQDGIRLYLDGQCVIDRWRDQEWESSKEVCVVPLTTGFHRIKVEHYSRSGPACFWVRWAAPGASRLTVIGVESLRYRKPSGAMP
jgi:hypothetical protein